MIVFDLQCTHGGHRFEGWFKSSDDFSGQQERGLLTCPECSSPDVVKALMAPHLGRKGNQLAAAAPRAAPDGGAPAGNPRPMHNGQPVHGTLPPEAVKMMRKLAQLQAEALKQSRWVGDSFAEDARAMHYGERAMEGIHGEATIEEAEELLEEGIAVAPLPFPVLPPDKAN